jgi:hypothetical protein
VAASLLRLPSARRIRSASVSSGSASAQWPSSCCRCPRLFCGTGDGCADGYVNQNNYTNAWATFGTICTTDGTATITLADDGGDAYPAQVGADAIRAVHTGIAC